MVLSKSTPINRRAAQENAAMQEQKRAANLAAQNKEALRSDVTNLNTVLSQKSSLLDPNEKGIQESEKLQRQEKLDAFNTDYNNALASKNSSAGQQQYFTGLENQPVQDKFKTPTNDLGLGFNPTNITVQNNQITPTNDLMGLDGRFDARAISRLRAAGKSDADIKKMINGLKPSIKETMSNTPNSGENTTTASNFLTQNNQKLPFGGSIKTEQFGENGNREYILDNGTRVSADAYDKELQSSFNAAKDQKATDANFKKSNVAVPTETTTGTTPTVPRKDYTPEISNLVDSVYGKDNPMGSMLKMQAAQALADKQIALEQAALDKNTAIASAQTDGDAYQTILDTIQSKYEANKSDYDKMITDKAESEQKFLLAQQERDENYLKFQKSEAIRQGEQEKTQAILKLSISQALGGKAFSGASNEQIAITESRFSDSIKSLAKSYDFKISDSVAAYTQKYQDVNTQFRFDLKAASDALDQKIGAYSVDSFSNKKAIADAKAAARSSYAKEVKSITDGYTAGINNMVDIIAGKTKEQEDRQFAREKEERDNYEFDKRLQQQLDREDLRYSRDLMMSNAKEQAAEAKAKIAEQKNQVKNEQADRKIVISQIDKFKTEAVYKDAVQANVGSNLVNDIFKAAQASGKKIDASIAKEMITVLHEKGIDPTSVVREGEYDRAGLAQGMGVKIQMAFNKFLANGDATGLSQEVIEGFVKGINVSSDSRMKTMNDYLVPVLNGITEFNAQSDYISVNPSSFFSPDILSKNDWAVKSYYDDQNSSATNSTDNSWSYPPATGVNQIVKPTEQANNVNQSSFIDTGLNMHDVMDSWTDLDTENNPLTSDFTSAIQGLTLGDAFSSLGTVTQSFNTPIYAQNYGEKTVSAWGGIHNGIDIAIPKGSYVPAPATGKIKSLSYDKKGWGMNVVIEDKNGAEIRIAHLESVSPYIKVGDQLKQGQLIAQVGNTGNVFSTTGGDGTHLDLRVKLKGKYIDPFTYNIS